MSKCGKKFVLNLFFRIYYSKSDCYRVVHDFCHNKALAVHANIITGKCKLSNQKTALVLVTYNMNEQKCKFGILPFFLQNSRKLSVCLTKMATVQSPLRSWGQ